MMSVAPHMPLQNKIQRINQRKEKYKRSTNNSHKKFICVARKLLFRMCRHCERELFEKEFELYQNSRVYYFIILSHVKIRMTASQRENFKKNLTSLLQAKVHSYNEEIRRTNNKNFINFRFEEIADIEFALKALTLYLDNKVEEAIEVIYKKEKGFVLKKQQYQMAINIVGDLEQRLKAFPEGPLFPYFDQPPKRAEAPKEKTSSTGVKNRKKEDEEWVEEKPHRDSSSRHAAKRRKQGSSRQNSSAQKCPLLFLQDSYPFNPHFYSTLFNYPDPQAQLYLHPTTMPAAISSHSNFNFYQPSQNNECDIFGEFNMQINGGCDYRGGLEMNIKKETNHLKSFYYLPLKLEHHDNNNKKPFLPLRQTGDTSREEAHDSDYHDQI